MHILIIPTERFVPEDAPCEGIFQYHQAVALHSEGVRVGVIAPAPWHGREFRERIRRLSCTGVVDNRFPFPVLVHEGSVLWPGRITWGFQLIWERFGRSLFLRYAASYGLPDLIHAHNVLFAGCLAKRLSDTVQIPYVITEHSSGFSSGSFRVTGRIREAYRRAHARIMVSPFLGKKVESMVGREAEPWEWVPNILPPEIECKSFQKEISKKQFRFLCMAQFVPVKNHLCLLTAFASVFRGREIELILGGDGPLLIPTKQFADQLGISSQVKFLGFQSRAQVMEEMQRCDVLVLPSLHETFGVVLIEAMSQGKPVIAPSGSGPDSIITEANGRLFRPGDSNSLAVVMDAVFTNYGRYDLEAIRNSCLSRYGQKVVVSRLVSIYSRVLGNDH